MIDRYLYVAYDSYAKQAQSQCFARSLEEALCNFHGYLAAYGHPFNIEDIGNGDSFDIYRIPTQHIYDKIFIEYCTAFTLRHGYMNLHDFHAVHVGTLDAAALDVIAAVESEDVEDIIAALAAHLAEKTGAV